MPVAKTASPTVVPTAPYAWPRNVRPSSRTSTASPLTVPSFPATLAPLLARSSLRCSLAAGSPGRLAVEHRRLTSQERVDDATGQLPAGVGAVAAAAGQPGRVDHGAHARVQQQQVRRLPGGQRPPVRAEPAD